MFGSPVIAQLVERLTVVESCTGLSMASEIKWSPVRFRLTGLSFSHCHLLSFSYPLFSNFLFMFTTFNTSHHSDTPHLHRLLDIQQLQSVQSIQIPLAIKCTRFHQNSHCIVHHCSVSFISCTRHILCTAKHDKQEESHSLAYSVLPAFFVVHSLISDEKLPKVVHTGSPF